ncbi:Y4bD/Y4pK family protein [Rhizobium sp. 9T]|uniref:Uncharacterized protein n=4 Tax=Rhizobium TaxID=379 RepID=A0A1C3YAY6_9HYPH|nr:MULTISPECIES: DUF5372 family protein [Rhizobium]ACE93913.1 hypothetical conserved protein [Rhizobium etli CIAT 652]APO77510.1 hypothetical protein AM571_PB00223 [Rhizobium etli 8C-3]ARM14915.1 hypothetical protein Bra5_PB00165 [Rhizobium phaseoli Brasil 5]ARO26857.1 hypothetical protein TAL182_PC00250 [Rhizobium sp. TAL182]ARQ60730.1 hypothetical protein Kim5_PA00260 [Rhizobium sp. Kim5]MBY4592584.1 Y4bD/Y4pK family protein [Rhizobium redzepovicii]MBY4611524.1 Y4bD/Y4pK family protein [Rh
MQFEAASRSSPKSCRRLPSRVHNAGFPTFEARVTYPFHPLVDQTVLVTGSHEHEGVHYLLILAHGGSFQIPAWMFDPAASSIEIVAAPRLSATKLVELRAKLCCLTIPLRSLRSPIAHSILRERRQYAAICLSRHVRRHGGRQLYRVRRHAGRSGRGAGGARAIATSGNRGGLAGNGGAHAAS